MTSAARRRRRAADARARRHRAADATTAPAEAPETVFDRITGPYADPAVPEAERL